MGGDGGETPPPTRFEPFFTTKEPGKGIGLDLSTVYRIVKQSGGSIWVCSEVGKSTTFKIYLPHVKEEPVPLPVAAKIPREYPRGHETILYVEDDEAVRSLVTLVLREHAYTVLAAANGKETIRDSALVIGTVDLMITDVVMPRMNGLELSSG